MVQRRKKTTETRGMSDLIHAPWTDEQVHNLNDHQQSGFYHPFTCNCPNGRNVLVATTDGWVCPNSKCGWEQTWAHAIMADASFLQSTRSLWARLGVKA